MESCIYLAWPESTELLQGELKRRVRHERQRVLTDGVIASSAGEGCSAEIPSLVFVRQTMPHACEVSADSVNGWAQIVVSILESLPDRQSRFRIHVFTPAYGSEREGVRRCELVLRTVRQQLRRFHRHLARRLQVESADSFQTEPEILLQLLLLTPTAGWASVTTAAERSLYAHIQSPYPGGWFDAPDDKRPPARAYRKLLEAQAQSGLFIRPGERVVDLGASPGSWSYVALAQGASVLAIDRSQLAPELMQNTRLRFQRGDGFAYEPDQPVDWLLCDIVAYPQRSKELLQRWAAERWCRYFCLTFKFRGSADLEFLDEVQLILSEVCKRYLLRRLFNNGNEVTAIGELETHRIAAAS